MQIVGIYEAGQVTELDGESVQVIRQRRPVAVDGYVWFRLRSMEEIHRDPGAYDGIARLSPPFH